ncbi:MAG: hypothetical protein ABIR32_14895 [Ilumatobacteraceae bacterium]
MDNEPADEIEGITVGDDELAERRARIRARLDGHPVASGAPPPAPPRLELLR